jgi:hypothetical protein
MVDAARILPQREGSFRGQEVLTAHDRSDRWHAIRRPVRGGGWQATSNQDGIDYDIPRAGVHRRVT